VHLKRIGDEVTTIARLAQGLVIPQDLAIESFSEMRKRTRYAQDMLRDALDCFARLDSSAARKIVESADFGSDELSPLLHQLTRFIASNPHAVSASLEILLVTNALESVCHHLRTISQLVIDARDKGTARQLDPLSELGRLSSNRNGFRLPSVSLSKWLSLESLSTR
jgi:phosphate transport system protein